MKEYIATISSNGQVTIPAEICKHLGITANEQIVFVIDDNGVVYLNMPRYPSIASLRGRHSGKACPGRKFGKSPAKIV